MVHEIFSVEKIAALKQRHPNAKIIAHPECEDVLQMADYIGSTTQLLKYTMTDSSKEFIVATETGILHQMIKSSRIRPLSLRRQIMPVPAMIVHIWSVIHWKRFTSVWNTNFLKLPWTKRYGWQPKPIDKMLELSASFGL